MIERLGEGIWEVRADFRASGGMVFPARMTIVEAGGSLVLHSPLAIDDRLQEAIEKIGPVGAVVAPNLLHTTFLKATAERFPSAEIHAPAPLRIPGLEIGSRLAAGSSRWEGIDVVHLQGAPQVEEFCFLHRPSKTLVVTDLLFNIASARNWLSRFVFRYVADAYQRPAQSRLWRWLFTKDREAAGASVEEMLALNFDRLVMAHGEVVTSSARDCLAQATEWMRGGRRLRLAGGESP